MVVGNGALGSSLALVLARRGLRVALVGEPHRPAAASVAAGAMLGCFGEVTTTLLKSEHGRTKLDMDVRATKLWDGWLARLYDEVGGDEIRSADGTIVMLNTVGIPQIDDDNYAAMRTAMDEYGEKYEDISPSDISWLDPDPGSRPQLAMFIPNEHAVNSHALLDRLQAAFTKAGGTVVPDSVSGLLKNAERVTGVTLKSGGELQAGNVVLAAGAATQHILDTAPEIAAGIPPMVSGYGVSALVGTEDGTTPDSVIRTPNRAFACGLHVVPRSQGRVYIGATNIISTTPRTTPLLSDVLFLLGCATHQVRRDLSESGLERLQVGNRPVPLDGFPLLGEAGPGGLWLMTGTYRDGLHQSPLLAEEMARRILGETPQLDLEMFRPRRAPIQALTREESIETAVTHMLATGYEYDWNIPIEWPYIMEDYLRKGYRQFAEELDPEFTPPPELLAASRLRPDLIQSLRDYYAASRAGE